MIAPIPSMGPVGSPSATGGVDPFTMPPPMAPIDAPAVDATDPSQTPATGGFGTMLSRAVTGLVDQVQTADRMQELAATGELSDPTMAIVETTKSELALSTAVQVRNRLIEGWQELSRMQV